MKTNRETDLHKKTNNTPSTGADKQQAPKDTDKLNKQKEGSIQENPGKQNTG